MKLTVYGDFNCLYSFLASQRASQLIRGGMAQVDWRAVEHDRRLALTGTSSGGRPRHVGTRAGRGRRAGTARRARAGRAASRGQ